MHERELKEKSQLMEKKDNRIENLEQQIRAVERKYKDELKEKQKVINRLRNDLEEKCDQIASLQISPLTTHTIIPKAPPQKSHSQGGGHSQGQHNKSQGHSIKDRYPPHPHHQSLDTSLSSTHHNHPKHYIDHLEQDIHTVPDPSSSSGFVAVRRGITTPPEHLQKGAVAHPRLSRDSSSGGSAGSSSARSHGSSSARSHPDESEHFGGAMLPMPPKHSASGAMKGGSGGYRRKMLTAQTTHFAEVRFRPASAKRLENTPERPVETEEILAIAREQRGKFDVALSGAGRIIPPISGVLKSDEAAAASRAGSRTVHPRAQQKSSSATTSGFKQRSRGANKMAAASQLEVETLAVDQVINKDMRKAQEFNSYGSDA